jgi:hypothetical protein
MHAIGAPPPRVPYASYGEFLTLAYAARECYLKELRARLSDALLPDDVSAARPRLGPEATPPMLSAFAPMHAVGTELLLVWTRGEGHAWCSDVSEVLQRRVGRAAGVFAASLTRYRRVQAPATPALERAATLEALYAQLDAEVHLLWGGEHPMCTSPAVGLCSVLLGANFYTHSVPFELTYGGLRVHYHLTVHLAHAQVEDFMLAVCMGTHARLGACSALANVSGDVLQLLRVELVRGRPGGARHALVL